MELNGAKILFTIHTNIPILGDLKITQTLVSTWIVMAILSGLPLGDILQLEVAPQPERQPGEDRQAAGRSGVHRGAAGSVRA